LPLPRAFLAGMAPDEHGYGAAMAWCCELQQLFELGAEGKPGTIWAFSGVICIASEPG